MHGLDHDQIQILRTYPYIADILDTNGVIQKKDQSRILQGHFGIVPGVLIERMASILASMTSTASLKTNYYKTLKTGDEIGFRGSRNDPEIYTTGEKGESILITENINATTDLIQHPFPVMYEVDDFQKSILNAHLLQSGDFQFASGATKMNTDGDFSGHYLIPNNHPFLSDKGFPFPFMKEIANQIVSLSNSLTNNTEGIHKGSTILLRESHISKINNQKCILIPGGSRITITGNTRIDPTNSKRGLVSEYTAFNGNIPIFHGKIKGIKIMTTIIFRDIL